VLPEAAIGEEWEQILREYCQESFERGLWEWYTDDADWPKERAYEKFHGWFDGGYHSGVVDLGKD
jgi:hypothetical protein